MTLLFYTSAYGFNTVSVLMYNLLFLQIFFVLSGCSFGSHNHMINWWMATIRVLLKLQTVASLFDVMLPTHTSHK
ncbi:hypothetical protein SLEP1_g38213 [Rubroshorea leprosula]|uniref:Uncharacterized protein n=1 Tax=Rubroshorea leprosula TaxID=152421 RepID=A0AAV5KX73_9ROSI|nr:hypothetical protein SLEP1_g38213 [Rubroshorea leprosula]